MPNLNRLRYEPYALVNPPTAASILRNATVISLTGGGGGGGGGITDTLSYLNLHEAGETCYLSSFPNGLARANLSILRDYWLARPFIFPRPATFRGYRFYINSPTATTYLWLGLATDTGPTATLGLHLPNQLLWSGYFDIGGSSAGWKDNDSGASLALSAGYYWIIMGAGGDANPSLGANYALSNNNRPVFNRTGDDQFTDLLRSAAATMETLTSAVLDAQSWVPSTVPIPYINVRVE